MLPRNAETDQSLPVHGGVAGWPDAEAGELGVDAAGEDEGEHAVVAEEGPDGVAERGRPVALHEEVAVPRHAVPEHGARGQERGAAGGGREEGADERGERAGEVPAPRRRLGVLAQVEAPEFLHAPELPRLDGAAALPHNRRRRFLSTACLCCDL